MRTVSPHPLFVICFILGLTGMLFTGWAAVQAADCQGAQGYTENRCDMSNQVQADASIAIGLCSLVVMIGGVGFQIGRSNRQEAASAARFPVAAGPPHPGTPPAPPPHQPAPWQGHP
jgi:hypothetical protein